MNQSWWVVGRNFDWRDVFSGVRAAFDNGMRDGKD